MEISRPPASSADTTANRDAVLALTASFLGWTLDAFDFFLVSLCLTGIAKDFGRSDKEITVSLAVTLAFRPLGALLFGAMADRYGRRIPLMLDLLFYSAMEVASGFAPGYRSFLVLRALFGIGMGGEWGVGASLAMEKAPRRLRGMISGLLQEGYAFGFLLASVAYFFIFPRFGWRPLFFLGGIPALLTLIIRFGISESEVWQATRQPDWRTWARSLLPHWKTLLYLIVLMAMMNFSSHGTQDLFPTFLKRFWNLGPRQVSAITAISMTGAITGGILFGQWSERIGRRRAMAIALGLALLVIPLWALSPALPGLIAGAFLMQFMVQGAWGVVPAHLSELSPDSARGFLPGFAYQCGVLIAGSISYLQAAYAQNHPYNHAMAMTMATVFFLAVVVILAGPERRSAIFGQIPL